MTIKPDAEEFYKKLKKQLADTTLWPSDYLFKFIVKSEVNKITQIKSLFDAKLADISTKASKNGKYTSVSIKVKMKNPEAVISKYIEVSEKVDDVISL